ncbi:uncharacterized protein BDZ83DRAFT_641894 [Colletotrichum acutatum]|uniref:Uncharacterized protein n=1 Tax=Glomerella acutata TaxID=27357 RepID=A0AAD8U8M8_GLOAC|nr:uncharacterized protein BDZ83DRAFT_641894 [Colletotrichum acutatum]KAK1708879.1 hypothetical protein BDZ83DRAFT_641894 [Colletotrichum acutatum]
MEDQLQTIAEDYNEGREGCNQVTHCHKRVDDMRFHLSQDDKDTEKALKIGQVANVPP